MIKALLIILHVLNIPCLIWAGFNSLFYFIVLCGFTVLLFDVQYALENK